METLPFHPPLFLLQQTGTVYRNNDWKSMLCLFWMAVSTCLCSVFYFPIRKEAACYVICTYTEWEKQIDYMYGDVQNIMFQQDRGKTRLNAYYLLMQVCHFKNVPWYINLSKSIISDMHLKPFFCTSKILLLCIEKWPMWLTCYYIWHYWIVNNDATMRK